MYLGINDTKNKQVRKSAYKNTVYIHSEKLNKCKIEVSFKPEKVRHSPSVNKH